jgi:hypothetical protein
MAVWSARPSPLRSPTEVRRASQLLARVTLYATSRTLSARNRHVTIPFCPAVVTRPKSAGVTTCTTASLSIPWR